MKIKNDTQKDYQERINKILIYIQEHLDEPITLDSLAKIACFSKFHIHRIFTAYTGETLNNYIRRVKLDGAASNLLYTTKTVTDIALDTGYSTTSSFAKEFVKQFKCSPSEFRTKKNKIIKSQITANHKIKDLKMDGRIENIKAKRVLYVRKTGPYTKSASEGFGALMPFVYKNRLMKKEAECIGICYDDPKITTAENLRYDACITIDKSLEIKPEGEIGIQEIPGGKYAIFLHKGSYENLTDTYNYIYSQWLTENKKTLRNAPSFELYKNRDPRRTKPENLRTEIYIPIE